MTSQTMGGRGVYTDEVALPYRVYDADHHIYPPSDSRIRHLPKKYHEALEATAGLAVPDPEGELEGMDDKSIATTIGTHPVPVGRIRRHRFEGAPTDGALWRAGRSRSPAPC